MGGKGHGPLPSLLRAWNPETSLQPGSQGEDTGQARSQQPEDLADLSSSICMSLHSASPPLGLLGLPEARAVSIQPDPGVQLGHGPDEESRAEWTPHEGMNEGVNDTACR